jgi:hypothetical protein
MIYISNITDQKYRASVAESSYVLPPDHKGEGPMSGSDTTLVYKLLEEIRRVVADAIHAGHCLQTGRCASVIARQFPNAELTPSAITDLIIQAAIEARVPIEISKPAAASGGTS